MNPWMVSRKKAASIARSQLDQANNVRYDPTRSAYVVEMEIADSDLILSDLFGFKARKLIVAGGQICLLTDSALTYIRGDDNDSR